MDDDIEIGDKIDPRYERLSGEDDLNVRGESLDDDENPFEDAERNPVLLDDMANAIEALPVNLSTFSAQDYSTDEERYQAARIPIRLVESHKHSFDTLMATVIDYISNHVKTNGFFGNADSCYLVNGPMWGYFCKAQPRAVTKALLNFIPPSTRTILGAFTDAVGLLALPHVTEKERHVGVYTCYVSDPNGPGAIYVGSSIKDINKRIQDHDRLIRIARQRPTTRLFYQYAAIKERTCYFRQVAAVPALEGNATLIRILETIIMIILDAIHPGKCAPRFTLDIRTLHTMQETCGIKRNEYKCLNRALPLKQGNSQACYRSCCNCHITEDILGHEIVWYYDREDPVAITFLCPRCYRHQKRTGKSRPLKQDELTKLAATRGLVKEGPCSNSKCGASESAHWYWRRDPMRLRVLCSKCYSWANQHEGEDRPAHISKGYANEKVCIDCGISSKQKGWHKVDDGFRCHQCHQTWLTENCGLVTMCLICHMVLPHPVPDDSICSQCRSIDNALRDEADHTKCWTCKEPFSKKARRNWAQTIRRWICGNCNRSWERGFRRIMPADIKDLDIRCGLCHRLYAKRWCFHDENGHKNLICATCKYKIYNGRQEYIEDCSKHQREVKEVTFYEHRCSVTVLKSTDEICTFLRDIHGLDLSRAHMEVSIWEQDCEDPTSAFARYLERCSSDTPQPDVPSSPPRKRYRYSYA